MQNRYNEIYSKDKIYDNATQKLNAYFSEWQWEMSLKSNQQKSGYPAIFERISFPLIDT